MIFRGTRKMNHTANPSKRPISSIIWQAVPSPTLCVHHYEVRDHEFGTALKRCVHCGSLESK